MKKHYISLFGGDNLPGLGEILATFSWNVIRAKTQKEAIAQAIHEAGTPDRWKWVLVKYPRNCTGGPGPVIHSLRLVWE